MRKLFTKLMLLTALFAVGGAGAAWAQTVLYERGGDGTAWSASDISETEWSGSGGTLALTDATDGLIYTSPNNGGGMYEKAITTKDFSKITINATWIAGSSTGRSGNMNRLVFGNVELRAKGQDQKAYIYDGKKETDIGAGKYDVRNNSDLWTITLVLDKAKGSIDYTIVTPKSGTKTGTIVAEEIIFTKIGMGFSRGGQTNTSNHTLKSISVSEEEQAEPTEHTVFVNYVDGTGAKVFETVTETVARGASFTPTYKETYNPGFYEYAYVSGGDVVTNITSNKFIDIVYSKTMKAAYTTYTLGGEGNAPFMLDYDEYGVGTEWTTGVSGRFDPEISSEGDNHYFTAGGNRGDNATTLTGSSLKDKVAAGKDFTLQFDLRIANSNTNAPSFTIYDNANRNAIFSLNPTAVGVSTWKINSNDEDVVTLPGTYNYSSSSRNVITTLTWYTITITRSGENTYATITNKSTGENVIKKKIITQLSETGGLGNMSFGTGRYYSNIAMDNILVRDVVDTDMPGVATTYTIKYVKEDGNAIEGKADIVTDAESNESVTATEAQMATFELNGKKYVYKEGNTTITTVADAASNVITLKFYEYSKWNYTVTTSYNNTALPYAATGSVWEDEAATKINVSYPRFQVSGTQLVEKAPNSNNLYAAITVTSDNFTTDWAYTAVNGKDNIYLLSEAEDLEGTGLTKHNTGSNFPTRLSGGYLVYGSSANLFTLPAGKYIVTLGVIGARNNNSVTYNIYAADKDTQSDANKVGSGSNSGNYLTQISSDEFTLAEATVISMTCSDPATTRGIDLVYVQKTGDYVAPTLDITSLYLTNPSFETGDLTGWTTTIGEDTSVRTNSTTGIDGSYLFNTWWHGYPITQTVTDLPAGTYKLTALGASTEGCYFTLFANDSESSELSATTIQPTEEFNFWDVATTFTLANTDNVTVGVRGSSAADTYNDAFWYKADNFRLALVLPNANSTIPAAIVTKLEAANPVNSGTVGSVVAAAYNTAKSTFEGNATLANYNAYLEAVATYNHSVAQYAAIASEGGALPIESTDGWAITTKNGALALNTWSTEGNSDGSGMTTPFIQDWVGSGTPLAGGQADGKLYYRLLLTPGENYTVTALVRAFNEAGTGVTGATYFVGDSEKSFDELGSACTGNYSTKGKFGTFSCTGTVGEDGILDFGVKLAAESPINWLSIKNITITAASGVKPTAIALDKTSATLTTGESVTLTATVTPEDADDKTVQWTSSNEAVATVSDGIVLAVGVGTATITAQAVDGNNVTATAAITVADAPAIANATAISGTGQYLLRNVATGKYLGQGNSYGTQASINDHAVWVTATKADDGTYKFTGVCNNSGLGSNGYMDNGTPVALTVAPVDGKNNVYTLSPAANNYVTAQAGTSVVSMAGANAASTLAQWQFIAETEANKNLTLATAENPVDVTYMIKDANFSRNVDSSVWTMNSSNKNLSGGSDVNRCAESYHATFTLSQVLTVPNGTYKMRAQAAANGNPSNVFVYANDETTPFNAIANGENSMTAMSGSFSNGLYYTEWVEVTVTDHKLTVGAKTTETGSWCVWDNFELYMTGYTPVTEITATIDKTEIEVLETAQVTATTTPAVTSFGVTYASSDENVATVDEAGKVTGVGPGTATISVVGEVETNVTASVNITVISVPLITEAVNLDFAEGPVIASHIRTYAKDKTGTDVAQMQAVTGWSFGVANGDARAAGVMAYGSSYGMGAADSKFYAPATNPSGEASGNALGMVGVWSGSVQYVQSVKIPAGAYVITVPVYCNGGATALTKNLIGVILDNGTEYLATTKTYTANSWTTETIRFAVEEDTYGQLSIGLNAPDKGSADCQRLWVDAINVEFEPFATENEIAALNSAIQAAEAKTLGFQKDEYAPYNNVDALTKLATAKGVDTSKSVGQSTVTGATTDLDAAVWTANTEEVNAFFDGTFAAAENNGAPAGWTMSNNTLGGDYHARVMHDDRLAEFNEDKSAFFLRFDGTNSSRGSMYYYGNTEGYTMPLKANTYYRVTVDFAGWGSTGKPLRMNVTGPEGFTAQNQQYNTANNADAGDNAPQQFNIVFKTAGEGNYVINFQTPGADSNTHNVVISNLKLFTEPESTYTLAVTSAHYGTFVAPFDVVVPDDVIAYSIDEANGNSLTMTSKATGGSTLPACTPVVTYSENVVTQQYTGYSVATSDAVKSGLLTGVFTATQAPVGSYVLQQNNGRLGFYPVVENKPITVPAGRVYLEDNGSGARSFLFDDAVVGIETVKALTSGEALIYNVNGVRQPRLMKGLNIVRTRDGRTTKVMVK